MTLEQLKQLALSKGWRLSNSNCFSKDDKVWSNSSDDNWSLEQNGETMLETDTEGLIRFMSSKSITLVTDKPQKCIVRPDKLKDVKSAIKADGFKVVEEYQTTIDELIELERGFRVPVKPFFFAGRY